MKTNDPRKDSNMFMRAKKLGIDGLKEIRLLKVLQKSEIPVDANILGGRFVLVLKNVEAPDEKAKVSYIAQGNKDKDK